jgi:hypothetical protein
MKTRLPTLFRRFKESWNVLAAFATWLLAIIGGFLLPPPIGSEQYEYSNLLSKLGVVVTIILVGLLSVLLLKWKSPAYTWRWSAVGLVAMVCSVSAFFTYLYLINTWTCTYNEHRLVIGSEFTEHGKQYVQSQTYRVSPGSWVMAHGGNVNELWTERSINLRCATMGVVYIATLPLFAVAIIGMLHAIYCYSPHRTRKRAAAATSAANRHRAEGVAGKDLL